MRFWKRKKQDGAGYAAMLTELCKRVERETEARLLREGKLSFKTDLLRALYYYLPQGMAWEVRNDGQRISLRLNYVDRWLTQDYTTVWLDGMNWPQEIIRLRDLLMGVS